MTDQARELVHKPSRAVRPLVLSKGIDQGVMALVSLAVARVLGPTDFAPIGLLLVLNSLAVQVSDWGLGLAVLRTPAGQDLALRSLRRVRRANIVILGVAALAAAILRNEVAAYLVAGGAIWAASAEAYVRKSAAVRAGAVRRVAAAESAGALLFAPLAVGMALLGQPVLIGFALVLKHVVEILVLGHTAHAQLFSESGPHARSGGEWSSQVLTYLVANVDYAVVSLLLAPEALSQYVIAFRMASALPALMSQPLTQVAFLELGHARELGAQRVASRALRRGALIGLLGLAAVLVAAPILPLLLGPDWEPVRGVMVVLAFAVPARLLLGPSVAMAMSAGGGRRFAVWEAGRLVVVAVATLLGALAGLIPAAACVVVATSLSIFAVTEAACRLLGVHAPRWLWPAAAVTVVATITAAVIVG